MITIQSERRNNYRFGLAYETFCTIPIQNNISKPIVGLVSDISQTGFRLQGSVRPGVGGLLSATLTCAITGLTENVLIEIVYVTSTGNGQYEIGAKFDEPLAIGLVDQFVTSRD